MECKCGKRMVWLLSNEDYDTAFWCECGIACIAWVEGQFEWHIPKERLAIQRIAVLNEEI